MAFQLSGVNWQGRSWRLVPALRTLANQVEAARPGTFPGDGTVASRDHDYANPRSGHRPDSSGNVHAEDIGNPPGTTFVDDLVEALRQSKDKRILYVIYKRRIFTYVTWEWQPYTGPNPHEDHAHVSVKPGALANQIHLWKITQPAIPEVPMGFLPLNYGEKSSSDMASVQILLNKAFDLQPPLVTDGFFGPATRAVVAARFADSGDGSSITGNIYGALLVRLIETIAARPA